MKETDSIRVTAPMSDQTARWLRAGASVLISGVLYTARDMAHQRMCQALEAGQALPFALKGAVIYFVGPTPARPGRVIGSAGPTTSSRMDAFSPRLIAAGLKAMIGKGYRNEQVQKALVEHGAVHLSTIGGAGAWLSGHVAGVEMIAYEDLGTEAIRRLTVVDFPAIVAYDSHGGSIYKQTKGYTE